MPRANTLTVVKLGGSLMGSGRLTAVRQAIGAHDGPIAVVPGGGPFADAVRRAQPHSEIDDGAAHCMALLAMAQFAFAVAAGPGRFTVATSAQAVRQELDRGQVPVWAPLDLVQDRTCVEESWRNTADSLALHLASRIGAERLVLVKQRPHDQRLHDVAACREAQVVDPLFPDMLDRTGIATFWIGNGDDARLARFLAGGRGAAIRLAGSGQ